MEAQHGGRDVEQGDLKSLPDALSLSRRQRCKHRIARHHPRRHVHDCRAGAQWLAVGITVERHETAFGLYDGIESSAVRQRPLASVSRDGAIDEAWIVWRQGLGVRAKPLPET